MWDPLILLPSRKLVTTSVSLIYPSSFLYILVLIFIPWDSIKPIFIYENKENCIAQNKGKDLFVAISITSGNNELHTDSTKVLCSS